MIGYHSQIMNEFKDYRGPVAAFYDEVVPYRERQDVGFFVDMAKQSGGPVLEMGCGTGRVLIPTARAGIEILGLDLSDSMLAICRQHLLAEAPEVRDKVQLAQGDMCTFDAGRIFNLVTIPFRPYQHLATVEDQMRCLINAHRQLAVGGRLVFDLFNPLLSSLIADDIGEESKDGPPFTMKDGRIVQRYARKTSRDLFKQIIEVDLIYRVKHPDSHEEVLIHSILMRYSFRYEVEHLLARCGFSVENVYADYDKSPFGSKYPGELIFVARKQ